MKQQFDRDWLQSYRHIPRRNSYLQNYFNMAPVAPRVGAQGNLPNFSNVGSNVDVDQRRQEGIAQGEKLLNQEAGNFYMQNVHPYIRGLPWNMQGWEPQRLLSHLIGLPSQMQTAQSQRGVAPNVYAGYASRNQPQQPTVQQPQAANSLGFLRGRRQGK